MYVSMSAVCRQRWRNTNTCPMLHLCRVNPGSEENRYIEGQKLPALHQPYVTITIVGCLPCVYSDNRLNVSIVVSMVEM